MPFPVRACAESLWASFAFVNNQLPFAGCNAQSWSLGVQMQARVCALRSALRCTFVLRVVVAGARSGVRWRACVRAGIDPRRAVPVLGFQLHCIQIQNFNHTRAVLPWLPAAAARAAPALAGLPVRARERAFEFEEMHMHACVCSAPHRAHTQTSPKHPHDTTRHASTRLARVCVGVIAVVTAHKAALVSHPIVRMPLPLLGPHTPEKDAMMLVCGVVLFVVNLFVCFVCFQWEQ